MDGGDGVLERDEDRLTRGAWLDLGLTVCERPCAHRDAHGAADEVGVVELDAGTLVAIVVEDLDACILKVDIEAIGSLGRGVVGVGVDADEGDVIRRDLGRPDQALVVVVLLGDGGGDATGPDAV